MDLLFSIRHTKQKHVYVAAKRKPHCLPDSTALSLKIETKSWWLLKTSIQRNDSSPRGAAGYWAREQSFPPVPTSIKQCLGKSKAASASFRDRWRTNALCCFVGSGLEGRKPLVSAPFSKLHLLVCHLGQQPFLSSSLFIWKMQGLDWVISEISSKKGLKYLFFP